MAEGQPTTLAEDIDSLQKSYRKALLRAIKRHPYDPEHPDPAYARAVVLLLREAAGNVDAEAEFQRVLQMSKAQFDTLVEKAQEDVNAAVESVLKTGKVYLRLFTGSVLDALVQSVENVDKKKKNAA